MVMRYRTSIFVAFGLVVLYLAFWREETPFQTSSHAVDTLNGVKGTNGHDSVEPRPPGIVDSAPKLRLTSSFGQGVSSSSTDWEGSTSVEVDRGTRTSSAVLKETSATVVDDNGVSIDPTLIETTTSKVAVEGGRTSLAASESQYLPAQGGTKTDLASPEFTTSTSSSSILQEQFDREHDSLGLMESVGLIYGNTLNHLVGGGLHTGSSAAALTPTESWTPYSNTPPYKYDPYLDYNSEDWKARNLGEYVKCDGPEGAIIDVLVFSGHPEIFEEPLIGSDLNIDSNLCFERQARLGVYGYLDEEAVDETITKPEIDMLWDTLDWKLLQEKCVEKNANRYAPIKPKPQEDSRQPAETAESEQDPSPFETFYGTGDARKARNIDGRAEAVGDGLAGQPLSRAQLKSRTAVLLRCSSGRNYTDNDLQNIRSLVTELALRSGGEYTVYLMVEDNDSEQPIWSSAREEALRVKVPKEFHSMSIIWNEAMMEKFYARSEHETTFHSSEWLPVQRFAYEYPQYDFFWNLELDYRYTGHHYNLLEKVVAFGQAQPRKGLWERNERFYIPSVHGPYHSTFRATIEEVSGRETVWGAPRVEKMEPVGPVPPAMDPRDDDYEWGVGEEADYLSFAPIFNPVNTSWTGKNDIWGYVGAKETPRRATVGMNSRCSKNLLKTMDEENLRGNYIGSEMGPQTVALLHGLKAVFAPLPMFFDRAWNGSSLDTFLNPGPKGESGSTVESPFSDGAWTRLEGSTWYKGAVVPRRLYNNWLGWEYRGIGGPKWEKVHGRTCLPPMLLFPIKEVVKPPPDHSSKA